jgi:hypothetical protein
MPVTRKQQILFKVETSEGVDSSPGGSDAIQAFEPQISDTVDVQERAPTGASLSRDTSAIGRQSRQITYRTDFRGSGDTSIPITLPDWATQMKATGFREGTVYAAVLGAVTGVGFMVGEQITQSAGSIVAVVVAVLQAGTSKPLHRTTATSDILILAKLTGTPTAAASVGAASGSTSTFAAVVAHPGVGMQPTSSKIVNVTVPSWSSTTPAVGDVLTVESPAGIRVGTAQIQADNGSALDLDLTLLEGAMLATYTLRHPTVTSIATIATATQTRTQSASISHNLDGRTRKALGTRGDWTLEGEAGGPMQFSWTFTGDLVDGADGPQITTSGLSTIKPPRLLGAVVCYGFGSTLSRLPTKRVAIACGNQVSPNLDANRDGGSTGSNVTDRNPSITITVDNVNGGFDWETLRKNSTDVRFGLTMGTANGNIVGVVAPRCQVTEIAFSDSDGISTLDITLKPLRLLESGDDELYIVQA